MNKILLLLSISLLLSSCKTYNSFFKETYTSNYIPANGKPIYRLKISNISEFNTIESSKLKKLKSLNITGIKNKEIDRLFKQIPYPKSLSVLIMDSINLKTIPNSILRFKNLEQVSLNYNPQLHIESGISILKKLPIEFLNLQNNDLYTLPSNIITLSHLKDLNLSNNFLNDNISFSYLNKLPKLTSLWLTNNELKELPETITKLEKLKYLYIEKNQLSYLPKNVNQMKKIWVIHAGHNNFKTLPLEFSTIPNLLLLHVNNCNIEYIPEDFNFKKSSIKGIILDNNVLTAADKQRCHNGFKKNFLFSIN